MYFVNHKIELEMKRYIITCIAALMGVLCAQAESISIGDVVMDPGETKSITISLTNSKTNLVSFQMDLYLPDGITINKSGCSLSSRFENGQELTIGKQADGVYRLTTTSFGLTPISGTSGTIINLSLTASTTAMTSSASIKDILFVDTNSESVVISDKSFQIGVRASQSLPLATLPSQTYGSSYTLPSQTDQGLALTWTAASSSVATISGNLLTTKGVGSTIVTATQAGNSSYLPFTKTYTLTVTAKNASSLTINSIAAQTYTGAAKTPTVTVKDGSTTLSNGTDYTTSYSNNINAGTATVTITGIGNYTGTKTANFTINKVALTITAKSYTINQMDDLPEFEVTYSGFVNAETSSVLTTQPTITCDAADSETAGVFDITPSGAAATNYSFNYVKGTLTIDEVTSVSIAVNSLGKGTYCSEFPLDFTNVSGIKAYIISGFNPDNGNLISTRVYEVPAGTGLFIIGTPGNSFDIPVKATDFYYKNMMKGITEPTVIPTYEDGYTNFTLGSDGQGGVMFKRSSGTGTSPANRAYVQIPTSMAGTRSSLCIEDDGTTGVEGTRTPNTEESVSIAVNSLGKGTYCSEFPLDFTNISGIKAYIISGFNPDNGNLISTRVYEVPAGTGLFIIGTPGNSFDIPVKATDFYYKNMMKGITEPTVIPTYEDGYTNFTLGSNGQGGVMFKRSSGTGTSPANRAYVQIPTSIAGTRSSLCIEDDGTTGVEGIWTPDTEESEGDYYNLNGQKVQSLKRGIYIKNGKKIIIH